MKLKSDDFKMTSDLKNSEYYLYRIPVSFFHIISDRNPKESAFPKDDDLNFFVRHLRHFISDIRNLAMSKHR